jgi:hypothetical protein
VVPDAEGLGDGIDVGAIAVAVKNKFELVSAATEMFVGDFSAHDMGGVAKQSQVKK